MNLGSLEVPQERRSAMFFATLFWREPDLQIYNRAQWLSSALTSKDFSLEIGFFQSFKDFFKEFNF